MGARRVWRATRFFPFLPTEFYARRPEVRAMSQNTQRRREIAQTARETVLSHLSSPLTIPELARECGTSPTVLKESFREEYGMPLYAWARRRRMIAAAKLLVQTRLSVAEIAHAVGYSNPSKFARAFSACLGMNPSAWRDRYGRA